MLVNCAYWDQKFPRHVSVADIRELHKQRRNRLIGIADLSCDINGGTVSYSKLVLAYLSSIALPFVAVCMCVCVCHSLMTGVEFLLKSTSIDRPTFVYDVETSSAHDGFEGRGVILLGVDNLPTELPREATLYFGDSLLPYLEGVASSDGTKPVEHTDLPPEVSGAVVTQHGRLTPRFEYIAKLRQQYAPSPLFFRSKKRLHVFISLDCVVELVDGLVTHVLQIREYPPPRAASRQRHGGAPCGRLHPARLEQQTHCRWYLQISFLFLLLNVTASSSKLVSDGSTDWETQVRSCSRQRRW